MLISTIHEVLWFANFYSLLIFMVCLHALTFIDYYDVYMRTMY